MLRRVFTALALGLFVFAGQGPASAQTDMSKPESARPAEAATPAASGLLAPGKAAGIRQAQGAQRNRIWTYVPFAVVGGLALLIVLATGDDDGTTTTTTTGTN
jgi:hypothetical protein